MYGDGTSANYQPLHVTDSWITTVLYRNGIDIAEAKPPKRKPKHGELITYGVFGPGLKGVLDAKNGALTWDRWEQGLSGRVAVFRSIIPADQSRYEVSLCCLPDGDGTETYRRYAGYHLEIAVDPQSGAILRLQHQDDLKSTTPLSRSDIMVEYGPVEIGGKTYVCPLRSVSIVRDRSVRVLMDLDDAFMAYGPYVTMLNDISFDRYHMFRSESHVLPDFTPIEK
jgi:hypothetical protein